MKSDYGQELIDPEIALSMYDKVFSDRSGDEIIFNSQISKVGIIAPIYLTLRNEYIDAFIAAVNKVGENSFYLSLTERIEANYIPKKGHKKEFRQAILAHKQGAEKSFSETVNPIINDWLFPLEAAATLARPNQQIVHHQILNNAIYSTNGNWGLWFSNDFFAIIGGSNEFVDTFYSVINNTIEEMTIRFVKAIQNKQAAFEYLHSLFGDKKAEKYIKIYRESS